ncbi:MAG: response regulator [Candidatus Binataceae bacterium]
MQRPTDLQKIEPVEQTDDLFDDIAWLSDELAGANPGRQSELMRLLLSRVTLDQMYQFCGLLDARGTIWEANDTALRAAGISRRDVHGRPVWEARWWQSSPEASRKLKDAVDRAAKGEFVRYDVDIIGRAGGAEIITIDFNIKPVRDRYGEVQFLICEGRDVTEQRRLEREVAHQREELYRSARNEIEVRKSVEGALRESEETLEAQIAQRTAEVRGKEARLRTIFETSYTYQGLLTLDGTLVDANATSLAGIEAILEDVAGKPFWDTPWFTNTPGMSERVRETIPVVAGGEGVRQEIYVNLPAGGWRWFDFQMRPIRNDKGAVISILAEAVEVTGRRQAEEALRQSQKMEAIGQLTGGVAHDFNNLLQVIIANLDGLLRHIPAGDETQLGVDARRYITGAMRGAERASSLTQRLLAFSRRQPLDPRPIDVNKLVAGMSDLLRRTLGETISIENVTANGLWRVHVDPNQLESAILNLAVNSRDAMPDGGNLTLETANAFLDEMYATGQEEVVPGQYVLISLTDTGCGMSREAVARAFEPFYTTKDVGHGTGLGLSQVYGFVKQSGGHVKIYTELGKGTTVKIYLPRLLATDDSLADAEPGIAAARGVASETILVVEDDEDVRKHTREILHELGYRTLEAGTAHGALQILQAHPEIQLLFTDVGLPGGMNGRQLADRAKGLRADLKVLFTTGYARNAIVHGGRLDPGVQLITKPFTYAALASKVRALLDTRRGPMRILLVEDDFAIQEVVVEFLEGLGFKIETAASAAEAMDKLRLIGGAVQAAIIDFGLPGQKGDVLVAEIRTIYPSLPIVVASGYGDDMLRARFKDTDHILFLRKPYNIEQLETALASVVAGA